MLKRYNDAIEALRQALRIKPEDADVWYNLGAVYLSSRDRTATMDAVRGLQRLDPAQADELFSYIVPR